MKLFIIFLILLSGCTNPSIIYHPEENIRINAGEQIHFENYIIKLVSVENDSRCAKGVQCIWEGTAKIILEINPGNSLATLDYQKREALELDHYSIEIISLDPYPIQGVPITPSEYSVSLKAHDLNKN